MCIYIYIYIYLTNMYFLNMPFWWASAHMSTGIVSVGLFRVEWSSRHRFLRNFDFGILRSRAYVDALDTLDTVDTLDSRDTLESLETLETHETLGSLDSSDDVASINRCPFLWISSAGIWNTQIDFF